MLIPEEPTPPNKCVVDQHQTLVHVTASPIAVPPEYPTRAMPPRRFRHHEEGQSVADNLLVKG